MGCSSKSKHSDRQVLIHRGEHLYRNFKLRWVRFKGVTNVPCINPFVKLKFKLLVPVTVFGVET